MEKIKIGDCYVHHQVFTQAEVDTFARITGDTNPLHLDAEYAKGTPFGRPIVHGFLAGAVFSKIFGTLFPGEGTIYLFQDMAFLAPVFVEETYAAIVEVVEVNPEKHRGLLKCTLENSTGKACISGTAKLMNARFTA
jgi:acyl dehydratase